MSTEGEVVVLAASDKYEELGRNPLDEATRATPAIAGGRMYLRTESHLVSIGGK
jgi:outer membrane protein assembly factor BamB